MVFRLIYLDKGGDIVIENPVFLSISGSHLYGIPTPEDCDLRGAHIISWGKFADINGRRDNSIEKSIGNVDLVSQEFGRFLSLMIKPNVNFIEQVLSPLRIITSEYYDELKEIARDCISKSCYSHWKGFAKHTQYHAVQEDYRKPKRNLYLLRMYYQGHFLAETGKFRSNLSDFVKCSVYNKELVEELFDCKRRNAPFLNKTVFLDHCSMLEKTLQEKIDRADLRNVPEESVNERAQNLYNKAMRGDA